SSSSANATEQTLDHPDGQASSFRMLGGDCHGAPDPRLYPSPSWASGSGQQTCADVTAYCPPSEGPGTPYPSELRSSLPAVDLLNRRQRLGGVHSRHFLLEAFDHGYGQSAFGHQFRQVCEKELLD